MRRRIGETFDRAEEPELLRRMVAGDKKAMDKVILRHAPLVRMFAKRYAEQTAFEDLEQAGYLGLLEAAKRFRLDREVTFGTYARHWVRYFVQLTAKDNKRLVKPPTTRSGRIARGRYKKVYRRFVLDNKREPTRYELASALEVELDELDKIEVWLRLPEVQIDTHDLYAQRTPGVVTVAADAELEEELEERSENLVRNEVVGALLEALTPRERLVVTKRLEDDAPALRELGVELGISGERVRQIVRAAYEKMREQARLLGVESATSVG